MSEETQVVFVNGGMTFKDREGYLEYLRNREVTLEEEQTWDEGDYLERSLSPEVVRVDMPCRENADYEEWKITFENYFSVLSEKVILVGFSLGGTFLARYLSENSFPKEVVSTCLVAPPYDDDMPEEDLAGGFEIDSDLSLLEENCGELTLMFSEEDDVVPVRHADKFRENLTEAEIKIFENKNGHFQKAEFPELVERIEDN
ncbi:MAG: alpha/beta hydrolase [Candidatus Nanohalobium sp.]